jgi:hypothetical protein
MPICCCCFIGKSWSSMIILHIYWLVIYPRIYLLFVNKMLEF